MAKIRKKNDIPLHYYREKGENYITFENSTIFSSTLYNKFLDADNKDRLVVMENLLDLKQITAFYAKTKDLIKETKKSLTEAQSKCTAKSSEISSITYVFC